MSPPNRGKPWTKEELEQVMSELGNSKTYEEISTLLGRTVGGIKHKILSIACNDHLKNGMSLEDAQTIYGFTADELNVALNLYKPLSERVIPVKVPVVKTPVVKTPVVKTPVVKAPQDANAKPVEPKVKGPKNKRPIVVVKKSSSEIIQKVIDILDEVKEILKCI
jgi:hypothetical protein